MLSRRYSYGCQDTPDHCVSRRDRSRDSAKALWANIPVIYRERATFHTDQYDAYQGVTPAERHKAITKKARKTNHIVISTLFRA
jgi:hypothetical protein